jgi:hypothetical protein
MFVLELRRPRLVDPGPVGDERQWLEHHKDPSHSPLLKQKTNGMRGCPKALSFHRRNANLRLESSAVALRQLTVCQQERSDLSER